MPSQTKPDAGRVLAASAVILIAASGCASPESREVPGGEASVQVDVFSGRENPVASLSDHTAQTLYEFIEQHEQDADRVAEPQWPLGFRGFVVNFDNAGADWPSARVLEESIVVQDDAGFLQITDESSIAYQLIWVDVRGKLDPAVVTAIEQSH